jgi:hypothetical protein
MERSAVLRHLNGKPTPIEVKNEKLALDRFYVGKKVQTPNGLGVVSAKPVYGRVEVTGEGLLFNGVPKKYKTSELKFVPATNQEAIDSLRVKAEKDANAFLESRGMKFEPEKNLRMVAMTHSTADAFVASQNVKAGSRKDKQLREIWVDADLDKAIVEYSKIAERVGAKIEKIEKVDEVHTVNPDTPDGHRILLEQGFTEGEIKDAIAKGDSFVVAGTHQIVNKADGSKWSTIRLYKGADRRDFAEELAHSVEEQGGIPGWVGGKEEHAKYIAKSIVTGQIDKISEFTAAGTKVTVTNLDGTVAEAKSVQDILGTVQNSVKIKYDSKYMSLEAGEGVEFVDKMPIIESKTPTNVIEFGKPSKVITEGEYAGNKELYAYGDRLAEKMRNNEVRVIRDQNGDLYFQATGIGSRDIPAYKYSTPLKEANIKVKAYILDMPAIYTCKNCLKCAGTCYALGSQEQYAAVKLGRFANLYMFLNHRGEFRRLIEEQITQDKFDLVRLHSSGDIFSQPYADFLEGIVKAHPEKKFYVYTKISDLDLSKLEALPNFNKVSSLLPDGSKNYGSLEYINAKAKEFGLKICPASKNPKQDWVCANKSYEGKELKCNLCTREKNMLFLEHGTPMRTKAVEIINDVRDTNFIENIQYSIKRVPSEKTRPEDFATAEEYVASKLKPSTMKLKDIDSSREWDMPDEYNQTVNEMVDTLRSGGKLPPILVNENGILMDGRHRLTAYRRAGIKENIPVVIGEYPPGSVQHKEWESQLTAELVAAKKEQHSIKRVPADKTNAVSFKNQEEKPWFKDIYSTSGEKVGTVVWDTSEEGLAQDFDIRIKPEFQKKGYGISTIKKIFDEYPVETITGTLKDEKARGFWKNIGGIVNDIDVTLHQEDFYSYLNRQNAIKRVSKEEFNKMKGKKSAPPPPPKVEKVEQEVPLGEKVSGLATSVEDMAVERGLVDTLGELPTYKTRNLADAAKRANAIINKDKQLAIDIAFGRVPERNDVRSQEMFTALSVRAAMEGDVGMIYELGLSQEAANIAAEAGQRVKAYDTGLDVDPVKAIQELQTVRTKTVEQKIGKKKIDVEKKAEVKKIKEEIAKVDTVDDWSSFVKTLEC